MRKAKQATEDRPYDDPIGGGGGIFGPAMLSKLAGHPKFGPKLSDPAFKFKIQMAQKNPQMMMQDPEMMEVLQAILGVSGMGGGGEGGATEGFRSNKAAKGATSSAGNSSSEGMECEDVSDDDDEQFVPAAKGKSTTPSSSSSSSSSAKMNVDPTAGMTPEQLEAHAAKVEEEAAKARIRAQKNRSLASKERGNELYKAKQFPEAIAAYDEAIALDPTNMMFLNNKAAVHVELGECDRAIELCQQALEIGKVNRASFEDSAKVYQRIAAAHLKRGDMPAAIASYKKAQQEHGDNAIERKIKTLELEHKKLERERYINPELGLEAKERGNTCFREGRWNDAIVEYEDAIKRDPSSAPYRNNLAQTFMKMMLYNDAKREVEKAIELDKTYVKAWATKGSIESFMKEYHRAMDSYKMGLQLEPENSLCKTGLNSVLQKIDDESSSGVDQERTAHAMADPEIQVYVLLCSILFYSFIQFFIYFSHSLP